MSYIPNVRNEYIPQIDNANLIKNDYWEGNLNEENKAELEYFDYLIETVASNFFANLLTYQNELETIASECNLCIGDTRFDVENIDDTKLNYDNYEELLQADVPAETKIIAMIQSCYEDWIEIGRNNFVVAMLDRQTVESID